MFQLTVTEDGDLNFTLPDSFDYTDDDAVRNVTEMLDHARAVVGVSLSASLACREVA